MDPNMYEAVMNDKRDELEKCSPYKISHQVTPNNNTVLHVAAEFGSHECVEYILSNYPTLLCLKNSNGDTPLHSAFAGTRNNARNFQDSFITSAKSLEGGETAVKEMLRARNNEGDTPFHSAARRSSTFSAAYALKLLFEEDPELDHGPNIAGESPLYLYVERGYVVDVLQDMLGTCTKLEYGGPSGRTALHAAVIHRKVEFLDELVEWKEDLIKERDANGRTPLHYAAEKGNVEAVKKLLAKDKSVAYVPVSKRLPKDESVASNTANNDKGNTTLHVATAKGDTKASTANSDEGITALHGPPAKEDTQASTVNDDEGSTALHLATALGDTNVMKELLTKCPDCWEMVNSKGQNILHISVDSERHEATRYISNQPWAWCLVNRKDHAGDTPMHLIANKGKRNSFFRVYMKTLENEPWTCETSDKSLFEAVREYVAGKKYSSEQNEGGKIKFTCKPLQNKFHVGSDEKDQEGKEQNGGPKSELQMILGTLKRENKRQKADEDITKMADTLMLVATLIATITFTAGFTLPGGYEDQGPNQGMAILVRAAAFKAFVITNTIALICSTSSVFLYVSASLFKNAGHGEEKRAHRYEIAFWLILIAMLAMMVAFGTGAYAVLANSSGLAIATCAVACSSFIVYAFELVKHFAGDIEYARYCLDGGVKRGLRAIETGIFYALSPLLCLICLCICVIFCYRCDDPKEKKASSTEIGDDGPSQSSISQVF